MRDKAVELSRGQKPETEAGCPAHAIGHPLRLATDTRKQRRPYLPQQRPNTSTASFRRRQASPRAPSAYCDSASVNVALAIGRIVLDGLDDLRTQVEGETWPPHRGASTRGLRR